MMKKTRRILKKMRRMKGVWINGIETRVSKNGKIDTAAMKTVKYRIGQTQIFLFQHHVK